MYDWDRHRYEEYVLSKMYDNREKVCDKLSKIVHPTAMEGFAKILTYCWFEGLPEAEKIAQELSLTRKDFLALSEETKLYLELAYEEEGQNDYFDEW